MIVQRKTNDYLPVFTLVLCFEQQKVSDCTRKTNDYLPVFTLVLCFQQQKVSDCTRKTNDYLPVFTLVLCFKSSQQKLFEPIDRSLVLVRSPYEAILSNFNRLGDVAGGYYLKSFSSKKRFEESESVFLRKA